jgi:hypothetical protein
MVANNHIFSNVIAMLNIRKTKILLFAQTALPESQFAAFKKLFLDELGERGLEGDLKKKLLDWNGRE